MSVRPMGDSSILAIKIKLEVSQAEWTGLATRSVSERTGFALTRDPGIARKTISFEKGKVEPVMSAIDDRKDAPVAFRMRRLQKEANMSDLQDRRITSTHFAISKTFNQSQKTCQGCKSTIGNHNTAIAE